MNNPQSVNFNMCISESLFLMYLIYKTKSNINRNPITVMDVDQ